MSSNLPFPSVMRPMPPQQASFSTPSSSSQIVNRNLSQQMGGAPGTPTATQARPRQQPSGSHGSGGVGSASHGRQIASLAGSPGLFGGGGGQTPGYAHGFTQTPGVQHRSFVPPSTTHQAQPSVHQSSRPSVLATPGGSGVVNPYAQRLAAAGHQIQQSVGGGGGGSGGGSTGYQQARPPQPVPKPPRLPYLDHSPSNRLVLALRSGLDDECEWALSTLLDYSKRNPDLINIKSTPGLLDALIDLIQSYLELRKDALTRRGRLGGGGKGERKRTFFGFGLVKNREWEKAKQRAEDASLFIRNISLEKHNAEFLQHSYRLMETISQSLTNSIDEEVEESDEPGGAGGDLVDDARWLEELGEMRLNLLDVLEQVYPAVRLRPIPEQPAAPVHTNGTNEAAIPVINGNGSTSEVHSVLKGKLSYQYNLFPQLCALAARSNDRALILSSFKCLTLLSTSERNEEVFTKKIPSTDLPVLGTSAPISMSPTNHPPNTQRIDPISRALTLLPLRDQSLTLTLLDYIYQFTLLPTNAEQICSRPDFWHVLKILIGKMKMGIWREEVEVEVGKLEDVGTGGASKPKAKKRKRLDSGVGWEDPEDEENGVTKLVGDPTQLRPDEVGMFKDVPEPKRSLGWMRYVYEADPNAEVTQVALWTAYRREFEGKGQGMLPAAEVIKHSTDAFPHAMPMVAAEKSYVIRGIKIRKRPHPRRVYRCRWQGCPNPEGPETSAALYTHITMAHLFPPPPPPTPEHTSIDPAIAFDVPTDTCVLKGECGWKGCTYKASCSSDTPGTMESPSPTRIRKTAAELQIHIRTHIPNVKLPTPDFTDLSLSGQRPTLDKGASGESDDGWIKTRYIAYATDIDGNYEPIGIPLVSALVFRNLVRCVKETIASQVVANVRGSGRRRGLSNGRWKGTVDEDEDEREEDDDGDDSPWSKGIMAGLAAAENRLSGGSNRSSNSTNKLAAWGHPLPGQSAPESIKEAKETLMGLETEIVKVTATIRQLDLYLSEALEVCWLLREERKWQETRKGGLGRGSSLRNL